MKNGTWVVLNSDKDTTYSYSIDIGFTPTEVVACELELRDDYVSSSESYDDHNFYINRGYVMNSDNRMYLYFHTLIASLKSPWIDAFNDYGKDSRYELQCTHSGSELSFSIRKSYYGSGEGTPLYTRAGTLYLSGTLVYK